MNGDYDKSIKCLLEAYEKVNADVKARVSSEIIVHLLGNYALSPIENQQLSLHIDRILNTADGLNLKICVLLVIYFIISNQKEPAYEFLNLSIKSINDGHLNYFSEVDANFCTAFTNF